MNKVIWGIIGCSDGTPENSSPYYAISFEYTDDNLTALVIEASKQHLLVNYSYSDEDYQPTFRL